MNNGDRDRISTSASAFGLSSWSGVRGCKTDDTVAIKVIHVDDPIGKRAPRLTVPVSIKSAENPFAMTQNACGGSCLHRNRVHTANGRFYAAFLEAGFPRYGEDCNLN